MGKAKSSAVKSRGQVIVKRSVTEISKSKLKDLQLLVSDRMKPGPKALELARRTVCNVIDSANPHDLENADKALFLLSTSISVRTLPGYATLDNGHIKEINGLIARIQDYAKDPSQKRPLNFLMLAAPGAGKSHFIRCVAESLKGSKVRAITCNLTSLQRYEDLIPALDAARNMKVEDQLPLLFLDEFDSDPNHVSLLLPLLWDGELNLGQRDLKLGRVIIVLAGSNPSLPIMMDQAKSMRDNLTLPEGSNPKIIDLLSRINGSVLRIPPFRDVEHMTDRRADKICMAIQLLRIRFGETLRSVPLALLKFIGSAEFRYGVRSIAHLVELIPFTRECVHLRLDQLSLPVLKKDALRSSSLAYHLLSSEEAHGVIELWNTIAGIDVQLPVLANVESYLPAWFESEGGPDDAVAFIERVNQAVVER